VPQLRHNDISAALRQTCRELGIDTQSFDYEIYEIASYYAGRDQGLAKARRAFLNDTRVQIAVRARRTHRGLPYR